jgi:hypothetical protein
MERKTTESKYVVPIPSSFVNKGAEEETASSATEAK